MPRSQQALADLVASMGLSDPRIAEAFKVVDRASFVGPEYGTAAYSDRPLGIPEGQTTSQPTLIAQMIDHVGVPATAKVLEVGTGCGFQTALLAQLAAEVYSIERSRLLADLARRQIEGNHPAQVSVIQGDGWQGHEAAAPYDAIIVSASASSLPEALQEQLREGGRIVIPIATRRSDDVLVFVRGDGRVQLDHLVTPARFVPLIKGEG
jgi:protein-L-isoaspartate(D-aspartate) O-methyltransferase